MRKYLAELFGTFALVFAGTGAIVIDQVSGGAVTHVGVGLTFGLAVMAMIYAVGDVSGAHLNPAVTLGLFAARRFPGRLILPYVASQCAGALLASLVLRFLFSRNGALGGTFPAGPAAQSFVLELGRGFEGQSFLSTLADCSIRAFGKARALRAGFYNSWVTAKQFYDWQTVGGTDDVMRLVDSLERADIRWCAIGGVAVNHWAAEPMVTQDVDFVVATTRSNARCML